MLISFLLSAVESIVQLLLSAEPLRSAVKWLEQYHFPPEGEMAVYAGLLEMGIACGSTSQINLLNSTVNVTLTTEPQIARACIEVNAGHDIEFGINVIIARRFSDQGES